jgi:hypothetical protein
MKPKPSVRSLKAQVKALQSVNAALVAANEQRGEVIKVLSKKPADIVEMADMAGESDLWLKLHLVCHVLNTQVRVQ